MAVEVPGEVAVTNVESEAVVVAMLDDGPYVDEVVEGIISEAEDES